MKKIDLNSYLHEKERQHRDMAAKAVEKADEDFHRQSADRFARMIAEAAQLPDALVPTVRIPHRSRIPPIR